MMNLRRQHKRTMYWPYLLVGLALLALIVNMLTKGMVGNVVRAGTSNLASVALSVGSAIDSARPFVTRRAIQNENALMREQLAQLADVRIRYDTLKADYDALLSEQGRSTTTAAQADRRVIASVDSVSEVVPYGTLTIGAGTDDGIGAGDTVFVGDVALGLVTNVSRASSLVSLFSAPGTSSRATLMIASPLRIEIHGRGSGNFDAMVPRSATATPGTLIRSPEGYVLAEIGDQAVNPADALVRLFMRVPFDLSTIRMVSVLTR